MAMALYRADLDAVRAELAAHLPPLQRQWAEWLRPGPWEWFATFTFASPVHPEQANKRWARWISAIQWGGARTTRGEIVWARATEQQKRGVIHFHAVLGRVAGVGTFWAMRRWESIAGGFARIEPYMPGRGGIFYLVKKGDVELSPDWFDQ